MTTEKFPREYRLLTPENFDNVFKKPIKASTPYVTILATYNSVGFPRLGLIAPKKQLKRAVWRNKFKRIIRENFRKSVYNLENLDIVVIAKSKVLEQTNKELDILVSKLWKTISRRCKDLDAS